MIAKGNLQVKAGVCIDLFGYPKYEARALVYAEECGIVEYHVKDNRMIFYPTYPSERKTYRAIVNLDTFDEVRTPLKKYFKAYSGKIGGKYQACWDF